MESTKIIRIVVGVIFLVVSILGFQRQDTMWAIISLIVAILFLVAAFKSPNQTPR